MKSRRKKDLRMTFSGLGNNQNRALIVDTSVIINLRASRVGDEIIKALPNDLLISDVVLRELRHPTSRESGEAAFVDGLIGRGLLEVVEMLEDELEAFVRLVSEHRSLGDGEAATIACAAKRGLDAALDDRKGRDVARGLDASIGLVWTVDLLLAAQVMRSLGIEECIDAVFLALRDGRMRIHEHYLDRVMDLIGVERARECRSLPGYRNLFSGKG